MTVESFDFAVDPALRRWSRVFGVRPERCTVTLSPTELTVTFGMWTLSTVPANVVAVEVDGPYRWWKIAGPPRLSLGDRGITFATNAESGVCIELQHPVGGLDPLHVLRHPNVTVTVADPERFAAALRRIATADPASAGPPASKVTRHHGTIAQTARALLRWRRRQRSVVVHERDVQAIDTPSTPNRPAADAQSLHDGVGASFHRRYRVAVPRADVTARDAMGTVQADPNVLTREDFAPFNRISGVAGRMGLGDRFVVELAGPWDGPVEVVDVTPTSFRLATLTGHMEAGTIEFSATDAEAGLDFTIESWARSADAGMDALYDRVGMAKGLQSEMWVEACEAFATTFGGGHAHPAVEIETERSSPTDS